MPKFDVASVRISPSSNDRTFSMSQPGAPQFIMKNAPISFLIGFAYAVDEYQVEGTPNWYSSELYDVSANAPTQGEQPEEQTKQMLQQLLAERFHLAFHREMRDMKGYALVTVKDGAKLEAGRDDTKGKGLFHAYLMSNGLTAPNVDMNFLVSMLIRVVGRPVINKTGLTGKYNLKLQYAPVGTESVLPSIYTALQEQLGLKLEPQQVPVRMFVIDHLDRVPTEN